VFDNQMEHTMLAIMVPQRVWACNMILPLSDTDALEYTVYWINAAERLANPSFLDTVPESAEHSIEHGESVCTAGEAEYQAPRQVWSRYHPLKSVQGLHFADQVGECLEWEDWDPEYRQPLRHQKMSHRDQNHR
jgi:hypothetical protein